MYSLPSLLRSVTVITLKRSGDHIFNVYWLQSRKQRLYEFCLLVYPSGASGLRFDLHKIKCRFYEVCVHPRYHDTQYATQNRGKLIKFYQIFFTWRLSGTADDLSRLNNINILPCNSNFVLFLAKHKLIIMYSDLRFLAICAV